MPDMVTGYLYDIQKFSVNDGPGIRTTVFEKGCPLRCLWCHSPESQGFGHELAFTELKCIGMKYGAPCQKACEEGAIGAGHDRIDPLTNEAVTVPAIDRAKCSSCMKCVAACPSGALTDPRKAYTVEEVMAKVCQDRRYYERSGGGVTISGGEPMSQFAFTLELAKKCKAEGFHVALDTTGYAPAARYLEILPYVDLFLYDLKHMDSRHHEILTGVPNELIHENARTLVKNGGRLQVRYPVIPKLNASAENIEATAAFCAELRDGIDTVQLLPYHDLGKMKYDRLGREYRLKNVMPPSDGFMEEALKVFLDKGLEAGIH